MEGSKGLSQNIGKIMLAWYYVLRGMYLGHAAVVGGVRAGARPRARRARH